MSTRFALTVVKISYVLHALVTLFMAYAHLIDFNSLFVSLAETALFPFLVYLLTNTYEAHSGEQIYM